MNLFYSDDEVYSITIERLYVPESAPNPVGLFYGLTIDRETGRVIYLKDYIPSLEALIQMVETGEYEVEYGGYHVMSQKEIVEHLRRVRTEEEWDTYYLNYYIDKEHIYIIAEDTWGDYSILKLKR